MDDYSTTFIVDKTYTSCVCRSYQRYRADVDKCVTILPATAPGHPENNSCPNCKKKPREQPGFGEPINAATGNMWHVETDYISQAPGSTFGITRSYNSSPFNWDGNLTRTFGKRWTQPVDVALTVTAAVQAGGPGKCWRWEDTGIIFCEGPAMLPPNTPPAGAGVLRPDGKQIYFNRQGTNWYTSNSPDTLTSTWNADNTAVTAWTYVSSGDERTEQFSADGRLLSIRTRAGFSQRYTYSDGLTNDTTIGRYPADAPVCPNVQSGPVLPAGRRICTSDQAGRQMQFEYDDRGRISRAIDPAGQSYSYEYDGPSGGCPEPDAANPACAADNLTKVTYPDQKSRTYIYNESAQINGGLACPNVAPAVNGRGHLPNTMTGLVDENGARYISWTYDCAGRATSSERSGGVARVNVAYGAVGANSSTVSHVLGTAANPKSTSVSVFNASFNGTVLLTYMSGRCAECGPYISRNFDAQGKLTSLVDFDNGMTCFAYDSGGRQLLTVQIEGMGITNCASDLAATALAAPARKTSTRWHSSFRLPEAIAEPNRRTTFGYDASGNLTSKTIQATSDASGVLGFNAPLTGLPRTWTYTVNGHGQVLTVKGPRSDVNSTTTYTYDGQDNLSTVTNAAGHVTTLSNYDVHGRPGRITDANGLVTDMSYSERGWLTSSSRGGETTIYVYDGVGQLTQVKAPGQAVIHYVYDDAHRLIGMYDNLGNTINYTLDLAGNRIAEQVLDPDGVLKRQTTRIFDTLNRVQQVTGAQQ